MSEVRADRQGRGSFYERDSVLAIPDIVRNVGRYVPLCNDRAGMSLLVSLFSAVVAV